MVPTRIHGVGVSRIKQERCIFPEIMGMAQRQRPGHCVHQWLRHFSYIAKMSKRVESEGGWVGLSFWGGDCFS